MDVLINRTDLKADKYSFEFNPIFTASKSGSSSSLQIFLNSKKFQINLDDTDYNPILEAAQHNHFDCVRILLQYLADRQPDEANNVFQIILNNGIESICAHISNNDYAFNQELIFGPTLLHASVLLTSIELLSILLGLPYTDINA